MKVSVIVPVYNVERYLEKCLNSLVNQTLDDIEIIVVNDGTKDNSQKIIDKFTKKYKNVKGYIKENGGLSSARNYGLKYATGEYIGFVDSDDYVELDMYEKLYNKAKEKDFDVVACNINYVYENRVVEVSSNVTKDLFDKKDIKNSMLNIYTTVWNKIYKKELFNKGVFFKEKVWYEDVEFLYRLYPYINSIGTINEYLYNYLQRSGAISKTYDDRVYNYIDNWNGIIEFYKKNKLYDEYKDEIEYCYVRFVFATFIKAAAHFPNKKMFDEAVYVAIKNVDEMFPKYKKNKYIRRKTSKSIYLKHFNKFIANIVYYRNHNKKTY